MQDIKRRISSHRFSFHRNFAALAIEGTYGWVDLHITASCDGVYFDDTRFVLFDLNGSHYRGHLRHGVFVNMFMGLDA